MSGTPRRVEVAGSRMMEKAAPLLTSHRFVSRHGLVELIPSLRSLEEHVSGLPADESPGEASKKARRERFSALHHRVNQ